VGRREVRGRPGKGVEWERGKEKGKKMEKKKWGEVTLHTHTKVKFLILMNLRVGEKHHIERGKRKDLRGGERKYVKSGDYRKKTNFIIRTNI